MYINFRGGIYLMSLIYALSIFRMVADLLLIEILQLDIIDLKL